mgnify:CR=1 FL=1
MKTLLIILASLIAILAGCADVDGSARASVRAAASVELTAAPGAGGRRAGGTGGGSSTGTGGAAGEPAAAAGAASGGRPAAGTAGTSSSAGAPPVLDPCEAPVLLAGAELPRGPWRLQGREWRVYANPQAIALVPLPCASAAIETDPFCVSAFPVLVEVCE